MPRGLKSYHRQDHENEYSTPRKWLKKNNDKTILSPKQTLALILPFIMNIYDRNSKKNPEDVEQLDISHDVLYKYKICKMLLYTQPKYSSSSHDFVLHIRLVCEEQFDTMKWSYVYSWIGGWFKTHMRLLVLLE
jgi:hypothetical protein